MYTPREKNRKKIKIYTPKERNREKRSDDVT